MTTRIELPGGGWAELRRPDDVPERLRRPYESAAMRLMSQQGMVKALGQAEQLMAQPDRAGELSDEDQDALATTLGTSLGGLHELNDLGVIALVASWSYGPAVTLEALLDLPGRVYGALRDYTAPLVAAMLPDFGPSPEPDSPTVPSTA